MTPDPIFISTPATLRRWLKQHHRSAQELWVGFHRKATGTPTLSWSETVDEALCFGWIDGVRRKLDATRYVQRLTPVERAQHPEGEGAHRAGPHAAGGAEGVRGARREEVGLLYGRPPEGEARSGGRSGL